MTHIHISDELTNDEHAAHPMAHGKNSFTLASGREAIRGGCIRKVERRRQEYGDDADGEERRI